MKASLGYEGGEPQKWAFCTPQRLHHPDPTPLWINICSSGWYPDSGESPFEIVLSYKKNLSIFHAAESYNFSPQENATSRGGVHCGLVLDEAVLFGDCDVHSDSDLFLIYELGEDDGFDVALAPRFLSCEADGLGGRGVCVHGEGVWGFGVE